MLNLKHHLCGLHLDHLHNGGQQTPRYISSPRTFMGSGSMFRGESGSYEEAIFTGRQAMAAYSLAYSKLTSLKSISDSRPERPLFYLSDD